MNIENEKIALAALTQNRGETARLAKYLDVAPQAISGWKKRGIPFRYLPTIWKLLETRFQDVSKNMDRNKFLGVLTEGWDAVE